MVPALTINRAFDLMFALLAPITLSPVPGGIALQAWARLGSPVLFRQQRPGLHGKPLSNYKFRK